MERRGLLAAYLYIVFLRTFAGCIELNIYISETSGKDGMTCSLEAPCKTLNHGYGIAIKNGSISSINLILNGSYKLNKSLFVNISNNRLKTLRIYSDNKTEVIGYEKASIVIGCKEISSCIGYNISVENLVFRNYSKGPVITAYDVPSLKITNCTFERNRGTLLEVYDTSFYLSRSDFIGEQETLPTANLTPIYTNMSFCGGGTVQLMFETGHNKCISIQNSRFFNTSASTIKTGNCGGALSLVFVRNSSNNNVNIEASHFEGNYALFGGGLSIELLGHTSSNKFTITNTTFSRNYAIKSGGGFSLEAFYGTSKSSISFRNVTFLSNTAELSGGAGKLTFHNVENEAIQHHFEATKFIGNRAEIHAAIGLVQTYRPSSLMQRMVAVFKDAYFTRNSFLHNTSFTHSGTLCTFYVDIQFTGNNTFINNYLNSPLYAGGSNIIVSGYLSFSGNVAYFSGGGMSLVDGSKLIMMPGVRVEFYNNYATVLGGAIFYKSNLFDNEVMPFNPLCFVQYGESSIPARDWNVTMNFVANGAGYKGAAVYATTINECIWVPDKPYRNATGVLRWSDQFSYTNNYIGGLKERESSKGVSNYTTLATDTNKYSTQKTSVQNAFPGENVTLALNALDEYGQNTSSYATLASFGLASFGSVNERKAIISSIILDRKVVYSDPHYPNQTQFQFSMVSEDKYNLILNGKMTNETVVEAIDHSSIHGARMSVSINIEPCPPGYKFDSKSMHCVCDHSMYGLTSCQGRIIRIQDGMWANVSRKSPTKLIIYNCPKSYCKCKSGESHRSDCEFNPKKPDRQCNSNREGMLCGKCAPKSSITLPSYRCIKCDGKTIGGSIAVFVFFMILTVVLCIGIIYFNPKLSEYLKGILFYTQILPYIFTDSESLSASVATIFCTFVNSVAVGSMPIEMCLFRGLDRIDAIGISYIIPSICVLILGVFYILNSCRILNFHRDSPFNAFWVLIIVIFKLLVETTMQSLACYKIDDELVFFFDGSVKCFSKEHLALFIPSVLILVFLVIPFPFVIILISFGYIRVAPHVSDIITKGYRDEFRWWCAFDVSRRLAYAAIYIFVSNWTMKKVLFIFLSVFITTTHAIVRPYKDKYANYGESFLLGFLTLIAAIQALPDTEKVIRNVASIIATTPTIIYTLIVVVYLSIRGIRQSGCKLFRRNVNKSTGDDVDHPMPVPKRVIFERIVYPSNRRGSDSEEEEAASQPPATCHSAQELCNM